jgi:hypothetical protein
VRLRSREDNEPIKIKKLELNTNGGSEDLGD